MLRFESKGLKPGSHLIGSRVVETKRLLSHLIGARVETRRFQSCGSTGFNLYSPTTATSKYGTTCIAIGVNPRKKALRPRVAAAPSATKATPSSRVGTFHSRIFSVVSAEGHAAF
jgi:hypothetical protein